MSAAQTAIRRILRQGITLLALLFWFATASFGASDAAHFWISTSSSGSSGPEAPAIAMTEGDTQTIYIWGRPTEGLQFRNISLNVVLSATGLDLTDGTFDINNAIDGSTDRFEFVDDSSATNPLVSEYTSGEVSAGDVDALYGLGGFSLFPDSTVRGMGPVCTTSEMNCEDASDGEPAWLLAEIDIEAMTAGSVDLYLQIGDLGMNEDTLATGDYDFSGEVDTDDYTLWYGDYGSTSTLFADGNDDGVVDAADYTLWRDHEGDTSTQGASSATEVRFGADGGGGDEPMHNASTDRSTNLTGMGDEPDAVITISSPAVSVPEPNALALMALTVAAAIAARSRRSSL